jgi:hypothetical protein
MGHGDAAYCFGRAFSDGANCAQNFSVSAESFARSGNESNCHRQKAYSEVMNQSSLHHIH